MIRMNPRDVLRTQLAEAKRRLEVCEARYMGLVRAAVSAQSVLWYSRDAALQREFEAGFAAGRAVVEQMGERCV